MILPLLLLVQVAPAAAPPPDSGTSKEVVVTGVRLADSEKAWLECRARDCPPDLEIEAALGHGENLFVAGDYRRAKSVLAKTRWKVRGAARQFPVQVGDLRRAEARIASHLGETDDLRKGMIGSRDALRSGLGADDARTIEQRLQIADALAAHYAKPRDPFFLDNPMGPALRAYHGVARDAQRLGLSQLEGRALLRVASLLCNLAEEDRLYLVRARAALKTLTESTDPRLTVFKEAAAILSARLATLRGDDNAVDRLIASLGARGQRPTLLYVPPLDWRKGFGGRPGSHPAQVGLPGVRRDGWIDVGFRIRSDGRVEDVEALRESPNLVDDWVGPALANVSERRYAPLALPAGSPGLFRIERHSFTASRSVATGGNLRVQNGAPRIVVMDLTLDPPAAAPSPAG